MSGFDLFEWLRDIPAEELRKTKIIFETLDCTEHTPVTAKYYKGTDEPVIYLIEK